MEGRDSVNISLGVNFDMAKTLKVVLKNLGNFDLNNIANRAPGKRRALWVKRLVSGTKTPAT